MPTVESQALMYEKFPGRRTIEKSDRAVQRLRGDDHDHDPPIDCTLPSKPVATLRPPWPYSSCGIRLYSTSRVWVRNL